MTIILPWWTSHRYDTTYIVDPQSNIQIPLWSSTFSTSFRASLALLPYLQSREFLLVWQDEAGGEVISILASRCRLGVSHHSRCITSMFLLFLSTIMNVLFLIKKILIWDWSTFTFCLFLFYDVCVCLIFGWGSNPKFGGAWKKAKIMHFMLVFKWNHSCTKDAIGWALAKYDLCKTK